MPDRLTIIVSGMIAGTPNQGGAAWAILQYLLGLRRLGHDVYLIESIAAPEARADGNLLSHSPSAVYLHHVLDAVGLAGRGALLVAGRRDTVGLPYDRLLEIAGRADLLLNVSGMLTDETLLERIHLRAYLDLDPAFVQLWHATQGVNMRFDGHHRFVTVGLNLGQPDCPIPTCDRTWIPTLQPVVLDRWPVAHQHSDAFTTIGNWRAYGSIEYEGTFYGQKAHSWRPLMSLPARSGQHFNVALSIHPDESADLAELDRHGWQLADPLAVANTPGAYSEFIRCSLAELAIAKSGYVVSRCGWFSDRSACYLASGKPVLAQDTGFGRVLPVGEGVIPFSTLNDAVAGVEVIRGDYVRHSRAARSLAEEYFDSDRVLTRLLRELGW